MLKWVLHTSQVTSAVVGVSNEAQLNEVLGVVEAPDLTPEMYAELNHVLLPNVYENYR